MRRTLLRAAALMATVLVPLLWPRDGRATSFRVFPIRVFLEAGKPTDTMKIINESGRRLSLQLNAVKWEQDAQLQDVEEPTSDLVFYPKMFTLEAGKTQLVRVGFSAPKPGSREKTYRLYIRELPSGSRSKETTVRILLRVGVPVFLAPLQPKTSAEIGDLRQEQCQVKFSLQNTGNTHVRMDRVEVKVFDELGKVVQATELNGWYVFPDLTRSYALDLAPEACSVAQKVVVEMESDKLKLNELAVIAGSAATGR